MTRLALPLPTVLAAALALMLLATTFALLLVRASAVPVASLAALALGALERGQLRAQILPDSSARLGYGAQDVLR